MPQCVGYPISTAIVLCSRPPGSGRSLRILRIGEATLLRHLYRREYSHKQVGLRHKMDRAAGQLNFSEDCWIDLTMLL